MSNWFKNLFSKKNKKNTEVSKDHDVEMTTQTVELNACNSDTNACKEEKKEEKQKEEGNTTTMSTEKKARNIYYVSVRKDKDGKKIGWEVKKEKAERVTKLCATKEEALEVVKGFASNQGSTCIIRTMDGKIQETIKFPKVDK